MTTGVIQAAARFEAELDLRSLGAGSLGVGSRDSSVSRGTESIPQSPGSPSGSGGSATGSTAGSKTYRSSLSASTSKNRNREEIRKEVISLVERVVPEELDHVDEMMSQFRGREEELVETLRNMLEREIAQKARKSINRQVKMEAREMVRENRKKAESSDDAGNIGDRTENQAVEGPLFISADGDDDTAGHIEDELVPSSDEPSSPIEALIATTVQGNLKTRESESSGKPPRDPNRSLEGIQVKSSSLLRGTLPPATDDDDETPPAQATEIDAEEKERRREALFAAVESGDWEAVGEAAAILSDTDDSRFTGTFESSRSGSSSASSKDRAARAQQLTALIDAGDWTGVVAHASRFNEADKTVTTGDSTNEDLDEKRKRQLKEEKDALDQAEMWMQIAEKSKRESESAEQQGAAAQAADWAIAQSLSQMEKSELDSKDDEAKENAADGEDEGSV